ncbi:hypothetical protein AaE_014271 [Aphanomyces astaci]|uniref:Uncharacterized protein n=1 Tax=Aphanomyces astaci TaxID=112090 RepID=A0A6A4ZF35_APHAT|nr:hypothetical protein AaE_014271 [Aphanomyces astaci]
MVRPCRQEVSRHPRVRPWLHAGEAPTARTTDNGAGAGQYQVVARSCDCGELLRKAQDAVGSDKYTWKKDEYNMYFQTCVALTNVHIRFNPFRNVDGEGYNQYKNRLLSIGSKTKTKNSSSKAKYGENRKAHIQAVLGRANTGYTSEDYDIGYEEGNDIFD